MRVNFIENICNNHYVLATFLREIGVDAHLYYPDWHALQHRPESENPELAHGLPEWLHPFSYEEAGYRGWITGRRELLEEIAQYDILHVHGRGVPWALQTGVPYVWQMYGAA